MSKRVCSKETAILWLLVLSLFSIQSVNAESIQQGKVKVSGVVKDEKGETLPGANVLEKGTTNGVSTGIDGKFALEVNAGAILNVSFMGFVSQDVLVGDKREFEIVLKEDTQTLDEVVVVGFGSQKKVNLTGAVGTADSKVLAQRPVMTATQALQGVVPGLIISQNNGSLESRASINIRGTATIGEGSSGSPLILIDGMEGSLDAINPQDIENISVLKDAAASSIYGSRAPFGVILVTTKSGKAGKLTVNYNNSFRWSDPVILPQTLDSYTFACYFNDATFNDNGSYYFSPEHIQRILDYQSGKLTSGIPDGGNGYWADGYAEGNANEDWYDNMYRSWAFSQEHNLSATGGSEDVNYYFSLNYLDQNGLMEFNQDKYQRYTATAKVNTRLNSYIRFNYSNRFVREDYGRPAELTDGLYEIIGRQGWPTLPLYDPNGYLFDAPSPALRMRDGGRDKMTTDWLYQQAQIIIEPVKDWQIFGEFNYRVKSADRHWDSQQYFNHDVKGRPYLRKTSSNVHEDHKKENYLNVNLYTDYQKSFANGHYFKVMVGFQTELMKQKLFGLQRNGIMVPGMPEVDLTNGQENGVVAQTDANGERNEWATADFFGRVNYNYKQRYLFEANLRYDGSSRFRRHNRWGWFPSVSVGWNIAQEPFMEDYIDIVNNLKIRGSYGELGNQNTVGKDNKDNWYPTYQIMGVGTSNGDWLINGNKPNTSSIPELVSVSLGWERIKTWDIGLDLGLLDNRLTGSFDYYVRRTEDMVGPAPEMPGILGIAVPKTNNTDLKTYGWELMLSWRDNIKNFHYGLTLSLSDAQTEITRYPNETGSLASGIYRKGQKLGEIWGYQTVGIAKTDAEMQAHLATLTNGGQDALGSKWAAGDIMYADLNGDKKIDNGENTLSNHGDLVKIGNSTPRYNFGIDLTAGWKGLDFRIFFQGVMKRDFFPSDITDSGTKNSFFWGVIDNMWWSSGLKGHENYFRPEGTNSPLGPNVDAYFPRPIFNGSSKNQQVQSRYLQKASYIRLKNVQLGYTLPAFISKKVGISSLRVFVSGENLWTGTKMFKTFDPEQIDGGKGGSVYPLSKIISTGLSITF